MAVLLSIKPQYCELIARGKKTIELRKTKPKIKTPFKAYMYCTKGDTYFVLDDCGIKYQGNGKVIGEFICDNISAYPYFNDRYFVSYGYVTITNKMIQKMCLDLSELEDYGNCKKLYGWAISDIIIYDKPKELSEFIHTRPPQSWCYVKELV